MQQTGFLSKVIVNEFNTKHKTQDVKRKGVKYTNELRFRASISLGLSPIACSFHQLEEKLTKDMFTLSPDN